MIPSFWYGTQKWHLLDNIAEYIRHVGGVQYLHESLYDSSHIFKNANRNISCRKRTAMKEAVMRQNKSFEVYCWSNASNTLKGRESFLEQYSFCNETDILVL